MRRISIQILALVAVGLLVIPHIALQARALASGTTTRHYSVTDLGTLGTSAITPIAINDQGQVVGSAQVPTGPFHAFRYDPAKKILIDLGTLGGSNSAAVAINESGQIVGGSGLPGDLASHAFVYDGKRLRDLGSLGGSTSWALAINEAGQAVGASYSDSNNVFHPVVYSGGGPVELISLCKPEDQPQCLSHGEATDINDVGQVVGVSETLAPDRDGNPLHMLHGVLWFGGAPQDLCTGNSLCITPRSINNSGAVVGFALLPDDPFSRMRGVVHIGGGTGDLGALNNANSDATDINDLGEVVGTSWGNFPNRAVLWSGVIHDLNDLIPANSGWELQYAYGINNRGQIVGTGRLNGQDRAFLLTPDDSTNCAFSLAQPTQNFNAGGGSDVVSVTTSRDCTWTAVSNASWITVTAFDGVGKGKVRYAVSPTTGSRTGTIAVAGKTFTVTQTVPTITIWLNAYIPHTLFWLTLPVPNSSSGETMIPGPLTLPLGECFLTDQRDASVSLDASSRMHSKTTINLASLTKVDSQRADPTIAVNCSTGAELGRLTADTSRMRFTNLTVSDNEKKATFTLRGEASNPFFPLDPIPLRPDIRYEIAIEVKVNTGTIHVTVQGFSTVFPAIEMYAAMDGGTAQPLFLRGPVRFSTPLDLLRPDATRSVSGRVVFQTQ